MASRMKKVSIGRELASARRSLRALEQSLARLAAQVRDISRNNSTKPAGKPRRNLKLRPACLKALRLHGLYLGAMRQLKSRAKTLRAVGEAWAVSGITTLSRHPLTR